MLNIKCYGDDYNEGVGPLLMTIMVMPMILMILMMSSQNWGLMSGVDKVLGNRASCSRRRLINLNPAEQSAFGNPPKPTLKTQTHQEADIATLVHGEIFIPRKAQESRRFKKHEGSQNVMLHCSQFREHYIV